jgi:hypothetical protein
LRFHIRINLIFLKYFYFPFPIPRMDFIDMIIYDFKANTDFPDFTEDDGRFTDFICFQIHSYCLITISAWKVLSRTD